MNAFQLILLLILCVKVSTFQLLHLRKDSAMSLEAKRRSKLARSRKSPSAPDLPALENLSPKSEVPVDELMDDIDFSESRVQVVRGTMQPPPDSDEVLDSSAPAGAKPSISSGLSAQLENDIQRFAAREGGSKLKPLTGASAEEEGGIMKTVKNGFAALLIADFFVVIGFLVWFIAATVQREITGNNFLLERFQDFFQPVLQPALGLLMLGSVASGVSGNNEDKKE